MIKTFQLYGGDVELIFSPSGVRYTVKVDGRTFKPQGVTSLCREDNGALLGWAVKCAGEKAKEFGLTDEQVQEIKSAHIKERDAKAAYGTAVHAACAASLELMAGVVEEADVRDTAEFIHTLDHGAVVTSFLKLLADNGLSVTEVERPIYSRKYNYAGTFDLLLRDRTGNNILADIKTGNHISDAWKQIAGYAMAYNEEFPDVVINSYAVLHLKGKKFRWEEHTADQLVSDMAAFKASMFLNQYNQKIHNVG